LIILVLGAGGFIGSHLTEKLVNAGTEVVAVDTTAEKIPPAILEKITFYKWDIREHRHDVAQLVKEAGLVIDLIAYANPSIYLDSPLEVVNLNFFENLRIVEYCLKYHKRLMQFSTCEVYGMSGGSDEPFSEEVTPLIMGPICCHRWIYASGKQFLERIIHAYGMKEELDYSVIRPFNFIGPKIDYLKIGGINGIPRVFSLFLSALIEGSPLYLVDGGENRRCFTYIDDAIRGIMMVVENEKGIFDKSIVNVGNPNNEASMKQLAELMAKTYTELTGKPCASTIETVDGEVFYGQGYQDCDRRIPNISKLRASGWEPEISLDETIRRSMAYYLNRLSG